MDKETKDKIKILLESLSDEKKKRIMEMRFGIKDDDPKTLNEIANILKISKDEVRSLEKNALKILKKVNNKT